MLIAAGAALIALLFLGGSGGSFFDVWTSKDFRAIEHTVEMIVSEDEREAEILAAMNDLKEIEKTTGKELNKVYSAIIKFGSKAGTTREDYDSVFDSLDGVYEQRLPETAEALIEFKTSFTPEEWSAFLEADRTEGR